MYMRWFCCIISDYNSQTCILSTYPRISSNPLLSLQPKQITDIKEFLELVSRKDTRSVVVKKNPENVKFKARTSRYLITLVVKDSAKAEKLIKMLPSNVSPTILN